MPPLGNHFKLCFFAQGSTDSENGRKEAELCKDSIVFNLHNIDLSKLNNMLVSFILLNYNSNKLKWYNLWNIKSLCHYLLQDALDCLYLNRRMNFFLGFNIMGENSNVIAIMDKRNPIGLIVSKLPGEIENADNSWKLRHAHTYLMILQNYYGVQHPIAFFSSYTQWRILSLENTDGFFSADEKSKAGSVAASSFTLNLDFSDYLV